MKRRLVVVSPKAFFFNERYSSNSRLIQPVMDPFLTKMGRCQSRQARKSIEPEFFNNPNTVIYCSPYTHTLQTLGIIFPTNENLKSRYIITSLVKERNTGMKQDIGYNASHLITLFPEMKDIIVSNCSGINNYWWNKRHLSCSDSNYIQKAESTGSIVKEQPVQLEKRVETFIDLILDEQYGNIYTNIVLISHDMFTKEFERKMRLRNDDRIIKYIV